ncbi:MAG: RibD family protein [Chroococcales cyanobacterium]
MKRPHTTMILAMTADGKIADKTRSPARFSSQRDQAHLEQRISEVDGVLFGAGTLRAYGTTLRVSNPQLLEARQQQNKPLQPAQIVCSASAKIDPQLRFFEQPVPHWLLTTSKGAKFWQDAPEAKFERILVAESDGQIDWIAAFKQFSELGFQRMAILGGGNLIASLVSQDLIDEFWFTVCPLILGGETAPTPVEGEGFSMPEAKELELINVEAFEQEVFLHYRRRRGNG